jgi:UDP-N-acetylmuramoylalanine--D-glutamate ligase
MSQPLDPLPGCTRVAVAGLGASGRAACRLLHATGHLPIPCDDHPAPHSDLDPFPQPIPLHALHLARDVDALVLSPSLNPEWPDNAARPHLQPWWNALRTGSIPILGEIELAFRASPMPWIAIGGTDGKSTTARVTHHLARALCDATGAGDPLLMGNSWRAASACLLEAPHAPLAVVEISAFQLFRPHRVAPRVAVLTNLAPDHLDHYARFEDYREAKLHLWARLTGDHHAVLPWQDPWLWTAHDRLLHQGVPFSVFADALPDAPSLPRAGTVDRHLVLCADGHTLRWPLDDLPLPGAHNHRNLACALLALRALDPAAFWTHADALHRSLARLEGLPHRLQTVTHVHGVQWIDDSKATNVHAALTALRATPDPLILLLGGVDKDLDPTPLLDEAARRNVRVAFFGQVGPRWHACWTGPTPALLVPALEEAVRWAFDQARPGDRVLLSPGCSSFDAFQSFEHRGRAFADQVRRLTASASPSP